MHPPDEEILTTADGHDAEVATHEITLAVWDLPSPLVVGQASQLNVGAKCSAGCEIGGHKIEICDEAGNKVATSSLGMVPWPETTALYWATLSIIAPAAAGTHRWTVRSEVSDLKEPHTTASSTFDFVTVKPPEYAVRLLVTAKNTGAPLSAVEVRIDFYKGRTDERGISKVQVPKGSFEVNVWKNGYELVSQSIDVTDNLELAIQLPAAPEPEDEYWQG